MGFDSKKIKQMCELLVLAALLVLALMYSQQVFSAIATLGGIVRPFVYGGVIAFVLNLPLSHIENRMLVKWNSKAKRPVSIILSILFVVLLITVVVATVVPQVTKTAIDLGNKLPAFADKVAEELENLSAQYPQLQEYVSGLETITIDWNSLLQNVWSFLKNGGSDLFASTVSVAGSIIGGFVNGIIAFIFAIYILGQKETLGRQCRRVVTAYCPDRVQNGIFKVCALLYRNFSNFISGQCLEACILGCMFIVTMTIFGMPYAVLVGVLIAFTALIPIVGAFIGCVVGAFLIMVDSPLKAVGFVVLFLVLQQIEGNLIYPRVVGNKVGLPSIWVLVAVSVGGSLFGIAGMLFFIPLVSTLYMLLRDSVNARMAARKR